jgi:ferredoxin-NADP reductase
MKHEIVKIKSIKHITHDVLQIICEKPAKLKFTPGQAADISINKEEWKKEKRPFTFTSLPQSDFLEFTIKTYPARKSVSNELLKLKANDELIIHDVFGAISYKGEGLFIAGGAGVTPFISIFRDLQFKFEIASNKLIFANKKKEDIINELEFQKILGDNFINILSDEKVEGYAKGMISQEFLKKHISASSKFIYICGPPPMMEAVEKQLLDLKFDKNNIIKEIF